MSISALLFNFVFTHITSHTLFPLVAMLSLVIEELAPLNRFNVIVWGQKVLRRCADLSQSPQQSVQRLHVLCLLLQQLIAETGDVLLDLLQLAWRQTGTGADRKEKTCVLSQCQFTQIHIWCCRVCLTFSDLVALFVRLGFDYVALYESLHDLLQAAIQNKRLNFN